MLFDTVQHPEGRINTHITPLYYTIQNGAGGGIRTHDPRFRRPMLYPAELLPQVSLHYRFEVFFGNLEVLNKLELYSLIEQVLLS